MPLQKRLLPGHPMAQSKMKGSVSMVNWLICAGAQEASSISTYLQATSEVSLSIESDAQKARDLLRQSAMHYCVVAGDGLKGPDTINVASAFVADACALDVALVVTNAPGSLRSRAKRAGISHVLTFEEIKSASQKKTIVKKSTTPVIAFVSGRGGTGKTTICALAGHIVSSWGMRVALVDFDLGFGNLAWLCGSEQTGDLSLCVKDKKFDVSVLKNCCAHISRGFDVYGPCSAPEYAELVQPFASQIIDALGCSYDLVLVDTTNNWNDAVASVVQMADRVAIVSDERPGAIPALSRCGSLAVRLGVARTRIIRIMNGCDPKQRDTAFVSRAASGLECAREIRVMDGEEDALELLVCGRSRELMEIENPLVSSLSNGMAQILRELGCLPEVEGAQHALTQKRRTPRFFKRKKQVMAYEPA